jgi:hyperosmotically inducible protein
MNMKKLTAAALTASLMIGSAYAADTAKKVDDSWITTKVKGELAKDSDTKAHKIRVKTVSGVVTLDGQVASAAEKTKAEQDARSIKGVVDVNNSLTVVKAAS